MKSRSCALPPRIGPTRIAVVGGGIGGMSMAYALSEVGLAWDLYEGDAGAPSASLVATGVATLKGVSAAQVRDPLFVHKVQGHGRFLRMLQHLSDYTPHHEGAPLYSMGVFEPFRDEAAYRAQKSRTYARGDIPAEVQRVWPQASGSQMTAGDGHRFQCHSAFFYPHDYTFHPRRVQSAWKQYVQRFAPQNQTLSTKVEVGNLGWNDALSAVMIQDQPYAAVVLALGADLPLFLSALGHQPLVSSSLKITSGYSMVWPCDGRPLQAALENAAGMSSHHFQRSALWGWKRGSRAIRFGVVQGPQPSAPVEAVFGSIDDKMSVQAYHSTDIFRGESLASLQQTGEKSVSSRVHDRILQSLRDMGIESPTTQQERPHRVRIACGARLTLPQHKPLWGPLARSPLASDHTPRFKGEMWQLASRLWVLGGFHKSGYTLAPALAPILAQALHQQITSPPMTPPHPLVHHLPAGVWGAWQIFSSSASGI